jgi:hypothetical protein
VDTSGIIYQKKESKKNFTFGLLLGLNEISVTRGRSNDPLEYLREAMFGSVFFPSLGVYLKLKMPYINNENIYVQYEGTFTHIKLTGTNQYAIPAGTSIYANELTSLQTIFNSSLFVKWELLKGKIRPTIQIGGFVRGALRSDFTRVCTITHNYNDKVETNIIKNEDALSKSEIGPIIGIGMKSMVAKSRELFIDLRYKWGTGLVAMNHFKTTTLSLNIGFQIGK